MRWCFVVLFLVAGCASAGKGKGPRAPAWRLEAARQPQRPQLADFPAGLAVAVARVVAARLKGADIYSHLKSTELAKPMPAPLLLSVYTEDGVKRLVLTGSNYREALLPLLSELKPTQFRCFRLDQIVGMLPPADASKTAETMRHGLDALKIVLPDGREQFLFPDEIVVQDMVDPAGWQVVLSVKYGGAAFVVARVSSWLCFPDGKVVQLERLRRVIRGVSVEDIRRGLRSAAAYLVRNQSEEGGFLDLLRAGSGRKKRVGYLIRQAYTAAVLLEWGRIFGDEAARMAAGRAIRFLLAHCEKLDGALWLREESSPFARLGPSAILLYALACWSRAGGEQDRKKASQLAAFLLRMQRPDGSFNTHMDVSDKVAVKRPHRFYPGEAVFALAVAGQVFGEKAWTEAAVRGMHAVFGERMAAPYVVWVDSWLMKAAAVLHRHLTQEELAFCFRVADKVVESQTRLLKSGYADYHGALRLYRGLPSCASDAAYGEGLAAAFALARKVGDKKRAARYGAALRHLAAFILRHQFDEVSGHFLADPDTAEGGFSSTLFDTRIRCDVVAHAMATLMAALEACKE